jgi:hypothetical protein
MILVYQDLIRSEKDAAIIATLNRKGWTERPDPPTLAASEVAEWANGQWTVRSLTAEEQAAKDAAAAEATARQAAKAMLADLKAGTGTQAERLARLEKVAHYIAKRMLP